MYHSLEERVLTLAGVFQAARLVRRTAQSGRTIDSDVETCLRSTMQTDADHAEDIYGGAARLRLGLQTTKKHALQNGEMVDKCSDPIIILSNVNYQTGSLRATNERTTNNRNQAAKRAKKHHC